jgi:outer membrane protein TolC
LTPLSPVGSPPAPAPVAAGPALAMSLAEAVAIGLRDNRTIHSAYLQRVAQRFDLVVAEREFVPKLIIAGGVAVTRSQGIDGTTSTLNPTATWLSPIGTQVQFSWANTATRGGGASSGSSTTTLNVTQPLLRGAGLAVNMAPVRIARLQEEVNRLTLKTTVSDTVSSIVLAYRTLQQAQQQLQLAKDSRERSRNLLETNQALIDAGRMAAADIVQTQSDVANQDVAVLQAEQARNSAQLALLRLLAVDLRTNVVASDPIKAEHLEIPLDRVIALGLDNRMDLLAQRKALEQDRQALVVAKNNRLWNLSVVGSVQDEHTTGSVAALTQMVPGANTSIGLQISIPIGDYTLRQGEIQAATTVRTAEVQLEDIEQEVEASIRDAVQGVDLSWRQVEAAEQARTLASKALEVAREKLKAGRSSNFEVLTFEADLRAADTQALAAAIAYLNALTSLDQQLGTTLETWRIALND